MYKTEKKTLIDTEREKIFVDRERKIENICVDRKIELSFRSLFSIFRSAGIAVSDF
jgi:hypothetical protein